MILDKLIYQEFNFWLKGAILILSNTPGVGIVHLDESDVIRNKLVKKVVNAYEIIQNNN